MFYEEKEIDEKLKSCPMCKSHYDVPLLLPCGESVCDRCIQSNIYSSDIHTAGTKFTYECFACHEEHQMTEKGLPTNKMLARALQVKPKKVFRSELVNELSKNINALKEKNQEMEELMIRKEEAILNRFEILRQQIHFRSESKINEINELTNTLIQEVDRAEAENFKFVNSSADTIKTYEKKIKESEEFCTKWNNMLQLADLNESEIKEANKKSMNLVQNLSMYKQNLKSFIFGYFDHTFVELDSPISRASFGDLRRTRMANKTLALDSNHTAPLPDQVNGTNKHLTSEASENSKTAECVNSKSQLSAQAVQPKKSVSSIQSASATQKSSTASQVLPVGVFSFDKIKLDAPKTSLFTGFNPFEVKKSSN